MKIVMIKKISICIIQFISSNPTAFKLSYENRKPHRRSWRCPQTAREGLHTLWLQDAVWHATSQEGRLPLYQVTRRWFTPHPLPKREQWKVLRRGDGSKLFVCCFVFFVHFLGGLWEGSLSLKHANMLVRHQTSSRRRFPRCNKPMEIWLQSTTNVPTIISSCWRWDAQVFFF